MAGSFKSYKGGALSSATKAIAKGLFQAAADIVNVANLKAPVETGQLKQSGKVVPVDVLTIGVRFSRASKDGFNVAARMENDENIKHPRGGQAHFLQESVDAVRKDIPNYVRRFSVK